MYTILFNQTPPTPSKSVSSQFLIACVTLAVCTSALIYVRAEPPPSANYLPPNQQPSNQYGPPQQQQQPQQPSNQYGAPSNSYIPPPTNNYAAPQQQQQQLQKPSQSYGAPSQNAPVYQQAPQTAYGAPAAGGGGYGSGGAGNQQGDYESNEPARYSFEYAVQDYQSGNDFGHMEQRDGDLTTGRYYVLLPDGRKQIVNYEADRNGYRPTITYEQTNQQGGGNNGGANGGGYNGNAQSGQFNGY